MEDPERYAVTMLVRAGLALLGVGALVFGTFALGWLHQPSLVLFDKTPIAQSTFSTIEGQGVGPPPDKSCKWERAYQLARFSVDDSEASALDSLYRIYVSQRNSQLADIWVCVSESERMVLVGPFHSQAMQWHSITLPFLWFKKGDCIISFSGDTVNASDGTSSISYPPLHMHHIHIQREDPHWWETHGDYVMDPKEGYNMSLPLGTCMPHDRDGDAFERVRIIAHLNDVRGLSTHQMSPLGLASKRQMWGPYAWYLRIKFRLAQSSVSQHTKLNKLVFGYPEDALSRRDHLNRYDVGNSTHVMFWQMSFPISGEFLPSTTRFHSHRARYAGYVLINGSHTLESLAGLPSHCHLQETCSSIFAVRQLVLDRAGSRVLCHDRPEVPTFVNLTEKGDGYGGVFDRQGSLECKPFSFIRGDIVTAFSFSTPIWAAKVNPFPQHTLLFSYVRSFDAARHGVLQVNPFKHGQWVMDHPAF